MENTNAYSHLTLEERSIILKGITIGGMACYAHFHGATPEILHEFVDRIIVHAPDKSSGRRLQEIEIIYNHVGTFDHSKVTLWKGKAV